MNRHTMSLSCFTTLLVSLGLAMLSLNVAQAKNIKKQNLLELMNDAESIVVGTVVNATDGFQDGLPYTEITLTVGQNIKGNSNETLTFRQFGLMAPKPGPNGLVNLTVTPPGWPTYAEGEQVMLFLHKAASRTGFRTTAGLDQGKFSLRGGEIVNGTNNDALFRGLEIDAPLNATQQDLVNQPGGAYAAEAFISLVRTAVEENWIEKGVMINAQ